MQKVFQILPPKPYTVTNFNYYCLYPPIFSADYATWWTDRANSKVVTPEFTCLLVRVCACSAQYLDADNTQKLATELGGSIQTLSENLHHAARQLSSTIGPGKGGISQVHQLFLTSAWFKSEGLFVESWHALGSCIHEAQEQGMHKGSTKRELSEFDTEMRRRTWCLLNQWDWQMSMLLSRPLIINQSSSAIELPSMTLESELEGPPAPVSHTASQCKLGIMIIKTSLFTEDETSPEEADSIRSMINGWLVSLPSAYRETDPDLQWDNTHIYVPFQRLQMHAIAYMTMLQPFKRFLTKTYNKKSSKKDKYYRASAVDIALHLMTVSERLFDQVFPLNAKFHLVSFLLFDTAAFLCSAVIHDQDCSPPRRDEILQAIAVACSLLQKLAHTTKAGAICYPILIKLARSLSKSSKPPSITNRTDQMPGQSMNDLFTPPGLGVSSLEDPSPPISWPSSLESLDSGEIFFPASLDYPVPDMETPPLLDISDLCSIDIGQFDQIWDWQNLDLTLLPLLSAHMPIEDSGSA
ncbi:hypothetical protein N7478_000843 [Penicillium angulare]|uniref:uncharacterized protein n=1 Tax=Penicillium angulare TaxID=116970 RepID=UPI00253F91D1|nr:uncharacterized protein N7478_000843 [Penicillium angulare]KAJ5291592.1 hypothetical protein N7478_000843 [Penicillium angulare]